ncbi:MAG: orotidine-5'-phosphate decarboxylase [Alcanivoracaceae bacterium]|nr:orotidine-5'-phosphate decarboxylase [Alcanivoracaceae bacterium]
MSVSPVIVALDYSSAEDALRMAKQLSPEQVRVKVGKELFTRSGPVIVEQLHELGFDVFLDLKFHDIPNTVAGAIRAAAEMNVWMVNVHASGGRRMMEAARDAVKQAGSKTLLTAVTVLTSMGADDLSEVGITVAPEEQVRRLALLTQNSGLDGVVCSAQEAAMLRDLCPQPFCLVTPGIRPAGTDVGDQTRILTPAQAKQQGVDYMVIGRPITRAAEPTQAVADILRELEQA